LRQWSDCTQHPVIAGGIDELHDELNQKYDFDCLDDKTQDPGHGAFLSTKSSSGMAYATIQMYHYLV
jgi:predicted transcriptional regulator of viral defense system